MRPTVPGFLFLLFLTAMNATASAGDFSGFYAGVNAGHAFERGERSGEAIFVPPGASEAEAGLPPSALDAADRMTGRDARTRAPAAARR